MIYRQIVKPNQQFQTNDQFGGASFQNAYYQANTRPRTNPANISNTITFCELKTPIYYILILSPSYINKLLDLLTPVNPDLPETTNYLLRLQMYRFLEQRHLLLNDLATHSRPYQSSSSSSQPPYTITYSWCSIIPDTNKPLIYLPYNNFYTDLIYSISPASLFAYNNFLGYLSYPSSSSSSPSTRRNYFIQILSALRFNPTIGSIVRDQISAGVDLRHWFDSSFYPFYQSLPPEEQFTKNSPHDKMIRYYFEHPFHSASSESIRPVIPLSTKFSLTFTYSNTITIYPNRPRRNNANRLIYLSTSVLSYLATLRLRHQLVPLDGTLQIPIVDLFQPIPLASKFGDDLDYNSAMLYPMQ